MNPKDTPEIPKGLVAYLKSRFPNALPEELPVCPQDVARRVGWRQVVEHLEALELHQEQQDANEAYRAG